MVVVVVMMMMLNEALMGDQAAAISITTHVRRSRAAHEQETAYRPAARVLIAFNVTPTGQYRSALS